MKILLTGATGFIGQAFLAQALDRGHEVAGLFRQTGNIPEKYLCDDRVIWMQGDLANPPWASIKAFHPDALVHSAWIATPRVYLESPENFACLEQSKTLIQRLAEDGVKRVLALGTCIEYELTPETKQEDISRIHPGTVYAKCKNDLRIAMEQYLTLGLSCSWARVFYPYGPGEHPLRLCTQVVTHLTENKSYELGQPESIRDYIYIDDTASALLAVLESQHQGPVNIGSGMGVTIKEIAQEIARQLGKQGLITERSPRAADPAPRIVASTERLRSLGWQPHVALSEGISNLIRQLLP